MPILAKLSGCHSNLQLLGNLIQSKATLFYIAKYFAKNKLEVSMLLTTIAKARNYTLMHRSQANDRQKDPVKRRVQFWMERIINSLDGIQEISDTQAASALLGLRAVLCTDPLKIVPIKCENLY